ncbi:LysR substrate binding domain-containing protein [Clostridium sp. DSM 8431]|nr:LysR substrate binding domain-containing protein [Clostridium sp. DSM 8431]
MNIRKLKVFYATANNLNMTKTAKELYISQPSVTQTIHEIEEELQVKLFDRIGKKLYLTEEGKVFLNYVRRILNLYEEGSEVLKEMASMEKGKITIGASTTIGTYILPEIIREFAEAYEGIEISLIIENSANIEKLILENKIDFAFVEG